MADFQAARAIGGAGTGKTRQAIEILQKAMERPEVAGNPFALGFSSFTRAARTTAAARAAEAWGVPQTDLERLGWFKTAHAVAYRVIGVQKGEVLGSSREDDKWISEALGSDVSYQLSEDEGVAVYTGDRVAAAALNYWSLARSLVVPVRTVIEADQDPEAPSADEAIKRIQMFEDAKRLDGRIDFTDMLARFVGVRYSPTDGPIFGEPDGVVPNDVVGWIFDEAQDASKLLDMACRRLVSGASCRWAWLLGDPFQVLYSWAGASSDHFMSWAVAKQSVMPRSYRCAPPIMALGERCLQNLKKGYWDRQIAPAGHDGVVVESENYEDDLQDLSPDEDTLVLARTNRQVGRIAAILDDVGVPFRKIKAKEGAYVRDIGMGGLWKLQHGQAIDGSEWGAILDILPSKGSTGMMLERGSKSKWSRGLSSSFDRIFPEDLPILGATENLRGAIADGSWRGLPDGGIKWTAAAKRWGVEAVSTPKIRIGTIHSAKGMEASKVVLLTSVGRRVRDSEEVDDAKHDEERRIEYVAVTRAKHKLIVAHDPRERYRMELPL